ncbi:MAG: hypothetical protein R3C70_02470 [Geminicoccaceae bacterium]
MESYRDEKSGRFVYRVADKQSGHVIHQSPRTSFCASSQVRAKARRDRSFN